MGRMVYQLFLNSLSLSSGSDRRGRLPRVLNVNETPRRVCNPYPDCWLLR